MWASIWHPRGMTRVLRLLDTYCFSGFRPAQTVCGVFGDPKARVIRLNRRSKKRFVAAAVARRWAGTIASCGACAIYRAATHGFFSNWRCGASLPSLWQGEARAARLSGGQPALHEALCLLCRPSLPIGDDQGRGGGIEFVWTVKVLDQQYMDAQLKRRHAFTAGDWH